MRYHEIYEGRDAPLYHFTRLDKLMKIVAVDTLGNTEGVSLTRNVNTPYFSHGFWNHVALVINQSILSTNYAMEPRAGSAYADDFTLFQKDGAEKHASKEQEEFISKPIKPLSRFLTHIVISDSKYTTDLIRFMKMALADKPMPKTWMKFSERVKRMGSYPDWNEAVLNPENWRLLFDYAKMHDIPLINRPLRMTFGDIKANLWHRDL